MTEQPPSCTLGLQVIFVLQDSTGVTIVTELTEVQVVGLK
jgi:hypothetical protein